MAMSIQDWLETDKEPTDLYDLVGRPRFYPDRAQLRTAVRTAYAELLSYQNHEDPEVARRAVQLQKELGRAEDVLSDPAKLRAHHEAILKCLREAYAREKGLHQDRSLGRLRSWLWREQSVHLEYLEKVAVALLSAGDKTIDFGSGEAHKREPVVEEPSPEERAAYIEELSPSSSALAASHPQGRVQADVCRLCGKGFSGDPDQVKDVKGRSYHRSCYEAERQRRQSQRPTATKSPAEVPSQSAAQQESVATPLTPHDLVARELALPAELDLISALDGAAADEDRSEEAVRRALNWELTQIESRLAAIRGRIDAAAKSAERAQVVANALIPEPEPKPGMFEDDVPWFVDWGGIACFGAIGWLLIRPAAKPVWASEAAAPPPSAKALIAQDEAHKAARSASAIAEGNKKEVRRLTFKKRAYSLLVESRGFLPNALNHLGALGLLGLVLTFTGALSLGVCLLNRFLGVAAAALSLFVAAQLWYGVILPLRYAMRRFPLFAPPVQYSANSQACQLARIGLFVVAAVLFGAVGIRFVLAFTSGVAHETAPAGKAVLAARSGPSPTEDGGRGDGPVDQAIYPAHGEHSSPAQPPADGVYSRHIGRGGEYTDAIHGFFQVQPPDGFRIREDRTRTTIALDGGPRRGSTVPCSRIRFSSGEAQIAAIVRRSYGGDIETDFQIVLRNYRSAGARILRTRGVTIDGVSGREAVAEAAGSQVLLVKFKKHGLDHALTLSAPLSAFARYEGAFVDFLRSYKSISPD